MSDQQQGSGTTAALVSGTAVGATGGYAAASLLKANRGITGIIVDKIHAHLDKVSTLEKFEAYAKENFDKNKKYFGAFEELATQNATKLGIPEETLKKMTEHLSTLKKMEFSEIPKELWKEGHEQIGVVKSAMEKFGLKKGFISSIPGGVATITSVSAALGAYLAYSVVNGIENSHRASVEKAAQQPANANARA